MFATNTFQFRKELIDHFLSQKSFLVKEAFSVSIVVIYRLKEKRYNNDLSNGNIHFKSN